MARLGRGRPFKPLIRKPITASYAPVAPVWVHDSPPLTATVGVPYSYNYVASGSPDPTYSVTSGSVPPGLGLNADTGVLSGTPEDETSATFEVTASNVAGSVTSPSTTIVVAGSPGGAHYVTEIGIFPGDFTTWGPGGFVGLQQLILLRSDGLYVRNASIANPAELATVQTSPTELSGGDAVTTGSVLAGGQAGGAHEGIIYGGDASLVVSLPQIAEVGDYEAFQQTGYTYTAQILVTLGPNQSVLSSVAASGEVALEGSSWWEINPLVTSTAVAAQMIAFEPQVTEQSTAHLVAGQAVPNIVANVMGGQDGTASAWTKDAATYAGFQAILQSQTTVFVSSPWGPAFGGYVRFGPQTGGLSSGTGNKVQDAQLQPSVVSAPIVTTAVTWVAQNRPPV